MFKNDVASLFITGVLIVACTLVLSIMASSLIKKILTKDSVSLPAMSIYINICRIAIWAIGISILLATCFGIDVSGIVTALGVGGIAISLGFKDTISNLISGVQVTSCKIMKPGDHVKVANHTGTVMDTTWRHTTIKDMYGETIIVPNSIINSNAIVKKRPFSCVRVHVQIHCKNNSLIEVTDHLVNEIRLAAQKYGTLAEDVKIKFSSIADGGAKGTVIINFVEDLEASQTIDIKDAVIKIIAPYVESA